MEDRAGGFAPGEGEFGALRVFVMARGAFHQSAAVLQRVVRCGGDRGKVGVGHRDCGGAALRIEVHGRFGGLGSVGGVGGDVAWPWFVLAYGEGRQRRAAWFLSSSHSRPIAAGRDRDLQGAATFGEGHVGDAEFCREVADGFAPDQFVELAAGEGDEVVRHGESPVGLQCGGIGVFCAVTWRLGDAPWLQANDADERGSRVLRIGSMTCLSGLRA